ncbi:MAG: ATP-binding cassette domain-containing protein [Geminicoccaceae bacterium]
MRARSWALPAWWARGGRPWPAASPGSSRRWRGWCGSTAARWRWPARPRPWRGIGFIPSERKTEGLVAGLSVAENMTLAALGRFTARGLIRVAEETKAAKSWIERLSIKTPSPATPVGSLSGGNQQKVVLAKWRIAGSRVVILDHPTTPASTWERRRTSTRWFAT